MRVTPSLDTILVSRSRPVSRQPSYMLLPCRSLAAIYSGGQASSSGAVVGLAEIEYRLRL